jgi:peroxiredoxin
MLIRIYSLLLLTVATAVAQTNSTPLKVGDTIPDVSVRNEADQPVALRQLVATRPTVLIFYRGGWCPYCTRHLKALAGIEADLKKAGAQLVAISMDKPEKLKATPDRESLGYQLLSDSDATAVRAFSLAFKVDDATIKKYQGYGIDLDAASGRDHHLLPHPAAYVVDPTGKVQFAHFDPDYKARLSPQEILKAVQPRQP